MRGLVYTMYVCMFIYMNATLSLFSKKGLTWQRPINCRIRGGGSGWVRKRPCLQEEKQPPLLETVSSTHTHTPSQPSYVSQDGDEVSVEMNGLIEHQKYSFIYPDNGLCGFNWNQHITHLYKRGDHYCKSQCVLGYSQNL